MPGVEKKRHETEIYTCEVNLTQSLLDARQLREFADSQMPRSGVGEVPWSTPLSADEIVELTAKKRAHFVTARLEIACEGLEQLPLVGIGALIRDEKLYNNPRLIIVVDNAMRGEGIGRRIASELLQLLKAGELVEAEVQSELSGNKAGRFFEALGFECVDQEHRTSDVPEFKSGKIVGSVPRTFKLYSKPI